MKSFTAKDPSWWKLFFMSFVVKGFSSCPAQKMRRQDLTGEQTMERIELMERVSLPRMSVAGSTRESPG